jgi:hypothetical protein
MALYHEGDVVTEVDLRACDAEIRRAVDRFGVPDPWQKRTDC